MIASMDESNDEMMLKELKDGVKGMEGWKGKMEGWINGMMKRKPLEGHGMDEREKNGWMDGQINGESKEIMTPPSLEG